MIEIYGQYFDWDPDKSRLNLQKHGVTFREAATTFQDEKAIYFNDERHSRNEDRFIVIGFSMKKRLLYTCYCYRENEMVTRIITARKANATETELYGGAE